MTTPAHSDLAYTLTEHYFGETVAKIIKVLFSYDQASLRLIKLNLPNHKLSDLKRSLLILVKYQLVDYVRTVKNFSQQYEYSIVPQRVFSFFRISKFIQKFSLTEGNCASIILTLLAEKALLKEEKLIKLTLERLKTHNQTDSSFNEQQIEELLKKLISESYIARTSDTLCINIERFDKDYRNSLIVNTIYEYYNKEEKVKHLAKNIIDLTIDTTPDGGAITAPLPISELHERLIPSVFPDKHQLIRYLNKLSEESNNRFFVTCGFHEKKGAMFALNIGLVIDYLVREDLSSIIKTRFGPKCCRVFKVLLLRGPLLLKQIEELIMLPNRDVREYSYMLIKEGFIRNRQVPKTLDNAPGKSVFIMSVELDQVVYSATDLCCRTINNLLSRHKYELKKNKPLLDRAKAVRELLGNDEGNISQEEWNQYFNSHELAQLNHVNHTLDKLLLARAQVDETLFLFHAWLKVLPSLEVDES